MSGCIHRFRVGALACTALYDGTHHYEADLFVANAVPDELRLALESHGLDAQSIPSPYTCLLVETAGRRVLLDTGGAGLDAGLGQLPASLSAAGIAREEIDVVVLTHGHPDHIGGNADDEGRPVYANARHVMSRAEWEFWNASEVLARVPEVFRQAVTKNLPPIADRVELTEGEVEVAPGIHILPTPGHTPGHVAVVLESEGEELLYISDAALHPMHLEHPEWCPVFDIDPVAALESKRMLCERATRDGSLVLAFHFDPFPSLGHIVATSRGWAWEPVGAPSMDAAAPSTTGRE